MSCEWRHKIFEIDSTGFDALALELFQFQYRQNVVYRAYVDALQVKPGNVKRLQDIPFLPIRFFKSHKIQATEFHAEAVFESSGTTQTTNSRHLVKDISIYEDSFTRGFVHFYGPVSNWRIIGLLPSYIERTNSSLVYMVDKMIKLSGHMESGFYLYEYDKLVSVLNGLEQNNQQTILIGVTFALLDLAEAYTLKLNHTLVMETGGMKGRRKEMIREEVHNCLKNAFGISRVHSEYGMTELLSQAYSKGNGRFYCPQWMKVFIRGEDDPLQVQAMGSGTLNIIDLANVYSCCFIATDDIGKLYEDESFEVLGRVDSSDLRGCSLMTA